MKDKQKEGSKCFFEEYLQYLRSFSETHLDLKELLQRVSKEKKTGNVVSGNLVRHRSILQFYCDLSNPMAFNGFLYFTVKPTIRMPHDSDTESEEEVTMADVEAVRSMLNDESGTLYEGDKPGGSSDDENTQSSVQMSVGDSQLTKRCKKTTFKAPMKKVRGQGDAEASTWQQSSTPKATAVQHITVQKKRKGYTTYPAYLFDVPPLKLNIENLCMQFLIAKIKAAKKQSNFYDNAIAFMGFAKESLRTIAEVNGFQLTRSSAEPQSEHCYAMSQEAAVIPDEPESDDTDGEQK